MFRGIADSFRQLLARVVLRLTVVTMATAFMAGCAETPSVEDCGKLLDKVVDLQIKEVGAGKELPQILAADLDSQRKKLKSLVKERFLKGCYEDLPMAFVKCGLTAKSTSDYADCEKQD